MHVAELASEDAGATLHSVTRAVCVCVHHISTKHTQQKKRHIQHKENMFYNTNT